MDTSILNSVKKILGISPNDLSFDLDVMTHINSAFSILTQMGIGPAEGYAIDDVQDSWAHFIVNFPEFTPYLSLIKTCVYLRVRLAFDPPQTSYHLSALEKQLQEHETRLSLVREASQWTDPSPAT